MKLSLTLFTALFTFITYSQSSFEKVKISKVYKNRYDYYIFDVNAGVRLLSMESTKDYTASPVGIHASGAFGYMTNPKFGIKGSVGFDQIASNNDVLNIKSTSNILRTTVYGVAGISHIAKMKAENFNLNLNVGIGTSTLMNKDYKLGRSKILVNNDNMLHVNLGINPQFHIGKHWSINTNIEMVNLLLSDVNADFAQNHTKGYANYFTASVGLAFHSKDIRHYRFHVVMPY